MTSPSIRPEKIEELIARLKSINRRHGYLAPLEAATALESIKAENDDLREANAKMRELLKPFADAAGAFAFAIAPDGIDDNLTVVSYVHVAPARREAHLGTRDFSAARAFLTAQEESDNG